MSSFFPAVILLLLFRPARKSHNADGSHAASDHRQADESVEGLRLGSTSRWSRAEERTSSVGRHAVEPQDTHGPWDEESIGPQQGQSRGQGTVTRKNLIIQGNEVLIS